MDACERNASSIVTIPGRRESKGGGSNPALTTTPTAPGYASLAEKAKSTAVTVNANRVLLPLLGEAPKSQLGLLPGKFYYFHAHKPSLTTIRRPKVLFTDTAGRICRLVFDEYDILRSITYIGKHPVQTSNLSCLIGLPASYMNRILYRYSQNEIMDLVSFLQSTWATALYHESFTPLRADLIDVMRTHSDDLKIILETVAKVRSEDKLQGDARQLLLVSDRLPESVRFTLQQRLLEFLCAHANHLPGYVVSDPPSRIPVR